MVWFISQWDLKGVGVDISIRKFRESDAPAFQEAVLESVQHLSQWLSWCTPSYSITDAVDWATSAQQSWEDGKDYRFLIENADTGEVLGCVGINQVVQQHKVGNLGYWVRKSAINQGVCAGAARRAVEFAFGQLGFQRIEIHVQVNNHASNAVALKLGGQYEGVFRNKLIFDGESVPAKCYSITPSDYANDQAPRNFSVYELLKSLELELVDPATRKNPSRLSELLAEEFEEYGSSGTVYRKNDILAHLADEHPACYELSGFSFRDLSPHCILVKYRSVVSGQQALRSSLWISADGHWQLLHHQSTVVP